MRILLLTRYPRRGASSRVRFYQYQPRLEARGVTVDAVPFFDEGYLDLRSRRAMPRLRDLIRFYARRLKAVAAMHRYDLVWLETELFPWLPGLAEQLPGLFGVPYVVDYDDAWFHRYDMHANPLVRAVLGHKIEDIMRRARLVVCGNEYIAARAREAGASEIAIIPSTVEVARYPLSAAGRARQTVKIGWIGSPATAPYLRSILLPLAKISRRENVEISLVGPGQIDLPGVEATVTDWSEAAEIALLSDMDIGIMPLTDGPWEAGKSGYKLIQYMAAGLPTVASPIGVNARIVDHGQTGYLARTHEDWVAALDRLIADPQLRFEMGRRGRDAAERRFSMEGHAGLLFDRLCAAAKLDPATVIPAGATGSYGTGD